MLHYVSHYITREWHLVLNWKLKVLFAIFNSIYIDCIFNPSSFITLVEWSALYSVLCILQCIHTEKCTE